MPSIATNDLHWLFDNLGWLLLPEQHIIEIYYNALSFVSGFAVRSRGSFPVIEVCLLFMTSLGTSKLGDFRTEFLTINSCLSQLWKGTSLHAKRFLRQRWPRTAGDHTCVSI
jgi:hypothetical protein